MKIDAMCKNSTCPSSETCKRFIAEPDDYMQVYRAYRVSADDVHCEDYIDLSPITIDVVATSLSTMRAGLELLKLIDEKHVDSGERKIHLDFSNVRSASDGFLNTAFYPLVNDMTYKKFSKKFRIYNANNFIESQLDRIFEQAAA